MTEQQYPREADFSLRYQLRQAVIMIMNIYSKWDDISTRKWNYTYTGSLGAYVW